MDAGFEREEGKERKVEFDWREMEFRGEQEAFPSATWEQGSCGG
jgi:hypothetical protein